MGPWTPLPSKPRATQPNRPLSGSLARVAPASRGPDCSKASGPGLRQREGAVIRAASKLRGASKRTQDSSGKRLREEG